MAKENRFFGNYRGIIISNNDPERAGRHQVYVPSVNVSLHKNWRETEKNIEFKFIGENLNSPMNPILEDLKLLLPWAEMAQGLVGEGAVGRYNAQTKQGTVSDDPNAQSADAPNGAFKFETEDVRLKDGFDGSAGTVLGNPLNNHYIPSSYSNCAKGNFNILSVGAKVWVFFEGGDPNVPVIFALFHGKEEWNEIYEVDSEDAGRDYPDEFENEKTDQPTTYRNKHVINEKGATIEIINTDNRESIKITQADGSFIEMNPQAIIEFAHKNKNSLTLGDKFDTVRGDSGELVDGIKESVSKGNRFTKTGPWTDAQEAYNSWMELASEVHELKSLFETRRTMQVSGDTSAYQLMYGTPAPHPLQVGTTGELKTTLVNGISMSSTHGVGGSSHSWPIETQTYTNHPLLMSAAISVSTQDGQWDKDPLKETIALKYVQLQPKFYQQENAMGDGSDVITTTKDKVETIGVQINYLQPFRVDPIGKLSPSNMKVFPDGVFTDFIGTPIFERVHVDKAPCGSYTLTVGDRHNIQVGSGGWSVQTTGVQSLTQPIVDIASRQTNILQKDEVNVQSKNIEITGDNIVIKCKETGQVIFEGGVGVKSNLVVGGSMIVDGNLYANKIHTPMEWGETEQIELWGTLSKGGDSDVIGWADSNGIVHLTSTAKTVKIYGHSHAFKTIQHKLYSSSATMRTAAMALNSGVIVPPDQLDNGMH